LVARECSEEAFERASTSEEAEPPRVSRYRRPAAADLRNESARRISCARAAGAGAADLPPPGLPLAAAVEAQAVGVADVEAPPVVSAFSVPSREDARSELNRAMSKDLRSFRSCTPTPATAFLAASTPDLLPDVEVRRIFGAKLACTEPRRCRSGRRCDAAESLFFMHDVFRADFGSGSGWRSGRSGLWKPERSWSSSPAPPALLMSSLSSGATRDLHIQRFQMMAERGGFALLQRNLHQHGARCSFP
jgi:hypothetical protein